MTLGASTTLTTTNNAVDFAATVDAATTGVQGLTVSAGTGAVTFGGTVGGSKALANLMLTGTGPTTLDGNVTTTGAQSYGGPVTLGASDILTTMNAALALLGQVTGGTFSLTLSTGTGAQTLSGITTSGNLILNTTGTVTLNGGTYTITGGGNPYVFPAVTTNGTLTFGQRTNFGAVTLGSSTAIDSSGVNGALDFTGTVDATTPGGQALAVNAGTGAVTFGGVVGGSKALASLMLTATGPTTLDGNVTTTGAQSYGGPVTLGASDTLTTTNAALALLGPVTGGPFSLTLSTGTGAQTLSGITTSGNLTLNTTGTVTLNGGTYTITGGGNPYVFPAVTTNGTLTFGQKTNFGAVTLGSSTAIDSSGVNGALDFTGTVDATTPGGQALTVNAGTGAVTFGGVVGGSKALASLMLTGTGPTTLGRQCHHHRGAELRRAGDAGRHGHPDDDERCGRFRRHGGCGDLWGSGSDGERRDRGGDLRRRGRRVEGAGKPDADRHRADNARRQCHHCRGAELWRTGDAGQQHRAGDDQQRCRLCRQGGREDDGGPGPHGKRRDRGGDLWRGGRRVEGAGEPDADRHRADNAGRQYHHHRGRSTTAAR